MQNFIQSDKGEDNAEFTIINPNFPDLHLEESDSVNSVNNATVVSTIINNRQLLTSKWTFLWNIFSTEWRSTACVQFYNAVFITL